MSDFKRNLVESADAAARVGVLFIAVAMFAAMWESDSPPAGTSDNWLARRAGDSRTVVQVEERSPKVSKLHSGHIKPSVELQGVSVSSVIAVTYPMPVGITPGDYRVVDTLGNVQTVQVTSEMVSGTRARHPQDQYVTEKADRTIYFIRIRNDNTIAKALAGTARR